MELVARVLLCCLLAGRLAAEEETVVELIDGKSLQDYLALVEKDFRQDASRSVVAVPGFNNAMDAGPKLVELFEKKPVDAEDAEWRTKHAIAGCLGMIGYQPAVPSLIRALEKEEDWRLLILSARSLALLKAEAALPRLRELEDSYWYRSVKIEVGLARKVIEGDAEYMPSSYAWNTSRHYDSAKSEQLSWLVSLPFPSGYRVPVSEKEWQVKKDKEIANGTYDWPTEYRRGPGELTDLERYLSFYRSPRGEDKRSFQKGFRVPALGTLYGDGMLLGQNDGEFGGELIYHAPFRWPRRISNLTIGAIYRLDELVVVIPAKIGVWGDKWIYQVVDDANGLPALARWNLLPMGLEDSGINESGQLELWAGAGLFILGEDGALSHKYPAN